jgi:hydrogenase-4 component F
MIQEGRIVSTVVYLTGLAVVFIGMGTIVLEMVQGAPQPGTGPAGARPAAKERLVALLPIAVLLAIVLMLGVYVPEPLRELLASASGVKGGGG